MTALMHLVRVEFDDVLIVILRLAQGVVTVDIFLIRQGAVVGGV